MGEFLRNLDWMECKEKIFEEFVSSLCYILRKKGVFLPYIVNFPSFRSSINVRSMYYAYKTKIPVGLDIGGDFLLSLDKKNAKLEATIESYKSQNPLISFISQNEIGLPDQLIPKNQIHLLTRLVLGHGIKGINLYMSVGGNTPKNSTKNQTFSILEKSIGITEDTLELQESGDFYDYGAPIGMRGQKNPSYDVVHYLSSYLRANGEKLLSAEKVYEEDFAILQYHPYSRLTFNTLKFGFFTNFQNTDFTSHPEFIPIHAKGLHPKWIDLQHTNLKGLQKYEVIIIQFSMFLDKSSMILLKDYVKTGGTLISFYEIPTYDEYMQPDETLSSLYKAKIQQKEISKEIFLGKKKFKSFQELHSFSLPDRRKKEFKKSDIITSDNPEKPKKIYGFHRPFERGHVYHFGFIPNANYKDIQDLGNFILDLSKSKKKTDHPQEITTLRLKCDTEEEIVTVVNLTNKKLENVDFTFNDVTIGTNSTSIQVPGVTILPQSATQWSLNKTVTHYANILACTSEIHSIFKRIKKDFVDYTISGFHFRGSRNKLELKLTQKPEKVISGKKDITKRIMEPDNKLRVQFQEKSDNGEKKYLLSAVYSDDLHLVLHFKGNEKKEILNFNIKKMNTFIE